MPGPRESERLEIEELAERRAEIPFQVSLSQLGRLKNTFPEVQGTVSGTARFEKRAGLAVAELTFAGAARLTCQRCLGPMECTLRSHARVALLPTEDASAVPEDLEPMWAPDGRIGIVDLVEEELMLALPIVPLHAPPCTAERPSGADEPDMPAQTSQRPFAQLKELMKGK